MTRHFTLQTTLLALCLLLSAAVRGAVVPVIITAGQSNTDGRVPSAEMPSYLSAYAETGIPNVHWSYGNYKGWPTGGVGVFAPFYPLSESGDVHRWAYDAVVYYHLSQHLNTGVTLYVIKESSGGSSIAPASSSSGDRHWSVDPTFLDTAGIVGLTSAASGAAGKALAPALIHNLRACLATIIANGDTPDIRCILWHQGESDRTPVASANAYHDNLQAVVQYIRDSVVAITGNNAYASLPFICGTVSKKSSLYNATIESAQYQLAQEMTNFHVIDMQDGTMLSDVKHFDAASTELFGQRLYNKLCNLALFASYGVAQTDSIVGVQPAKQGLDFGDEVVVADTTVWSFADRTEGDTIAKELVCFNGLYLRGHTGSHAITAKKANKIVAAYSASSPSGFVSSTSTAGMSVSGSTDRSFALNIAYPGTIIVDAYVSSSAKTRKIVLWFNGEEVASKTIQQIDEENNNHRTTLRYEPTTAGVVYITCENGYYIYSVTYYPRPTAEGGDDIIGEEEQPKKKGKRLHMCGDSMMSTYLTDDASNPEQFCGWGQVMEDYLDSLPVTNWAHTGTSAKGFYTSPRKIYDETVSTKSYWQCVLDSIHQGDYVILCWGHNDQKSSAGYRTWRESSYGTTSEYDVYMGRMITEAQAKGAQVIIASSICRNLWSNGHLSTLAQIDGSEEQGFTTEASNHDFDFPYGAQFIASQYGLPFINLTAETKRLFEGYGSKSGASVFFGNGGTTHTSELGARAVAQIADSILLSLDLMTRYIKADEIHIPWFTPGAEIDARVADSTVWVFRDYTASSVIDSLHNANGLYLRGMSANNHGFTVSNTGSAYKSQTFSNGASVSCSQFVSTSGSTPHMDGASAWETVTSSSDRCAAITTACPGTLYVLYYISKSADGRFVALSFEDEIVDSTLTANIPDRVVELKYHASTAGTFMIWSNIGWGMLAAQFVPDTDTSEDDWHEPGTPTGNTQLTTGAILNTKYIENGRVVILHNGRRYDILGRALTLSALPRSE